MFLRPGVGGAVKRGADPPVSAPCGVTRVMKDARASDVPVTATRCPRLCSQHKWGIKVVQVG